MIVSRHREERSRALLNMKISYFIVIISQKEGPAKRSVCDVMEHVMWLLPIIVFFVFTILSTCDLHIQCQKCKQSSHMSVGSKFNGSVAMVLFVVEQSSVQQFIFLCRNDTLN